MDQKTRAPHSQTACYLPWLKVRVLTRAIDCVPLGHLLNRGILGQLSYFPFQKAEKIIYPRSPPGPGFPIFLRGVGKNQEPFQLLQVPLVVRNDNPDRIPIIEVPLSHAA